MDKNNTQGRFGILYHPMTCINYKKGLQYNQMGQVDVYCRQMLGMGRLINTEVVIFIYSGFDNIWGDDRV